MESNPNRYTIFRALKFSAAAVFVVSLLPYLLYVTSDEEVVSYPYHQSLEIQRTLPQPKTAAVFEQTSIAYSSYHLLNLKEVYLINDKIQVLIEARDSEGYPQLTGGAYFRAKLVSEDIKAASRSDGEIVDFGNGTYLAEFVLRWPGRVKVIVMLVDGNAAVQILDRMREEFPNRGTYIGYFKNGTILEDTECNVVHVAPLEKECDYTDAETNIHWYCVRPTNQNLNCEHWWYHNSNNTFIFQQQTKYIRVGEEKYFLNVYKKYLTCTNCTIYVQDESHLQGKVDSYGRFPRQKSWKNLPMCLPGSRPISKFDNMTSGYFYKEIWYSTRCRNRQFNTKSASQCLTNKTVLILADSTGKQLYTYLKEFLKLKEIPSKNCMLHAQKDSINFTIYNKFHGLPSIGRHGSPSSCIRRSVANVLDHMTFIPDVFILSITAHFAIHTMDLLKERLQIIRAAVERLHKRNPNTIFIIKSANTREYENLNHVLTNNEWYLYTLDRLVREMFSGHRNVTLIDAWDMTVAQFSPDNIHPENRTVSNIVDLALSFICPV